jgi:hypothetical protein
MLLTAMERIFALDMLRTYTDDYEGLKQLRVDRENLSITPEEGKEINVHTGPDGRQGFDVVKADGVIKDCPISEYTSSVIRKKLAEMDDKKELPDHLVSLYEKFVLAFKK